MSGKKIYIIILSFITFLPVLLRAEAATQKTEHLKSIYFTNKDGLPRNIVSCYVQDEFGYSWIGTGNGISRFDGYSFVNYELFKGQFITSLLIDNKNRLWIGSDEGLYLYNRINDSFTLIQEGYVKQLSKNKDDIYYLLANRLVKLNFPTDTTIYEIEGINTYTIAEEGIWFGSGNNGLKLLDSAKNYIPGRNVSLVRNIDKILWFACRNGDIFCRTQEGVRKLELDNHQNITDIEKINNELWISTDGNGILILDENLNLKKHLNREQDGEIWLASNSIYDIATGIENTIWISTYGAGLALLIKDNIAFQNLVPDLINKNSLVDKEGVAVYCRNNMFFLGTNYGFSVWDTQLNKYTNFNAAKLKKEIQGSKITAICSDNKNNIWIGTYDGLIAKYSPDLKMLATYHPCSEKNNEMQQAILLYSFNDESILIGTQYHNKSLIKLNTKTGVTTAVGLNYKIQNKFNFQINAIRKNNSGELVALIRNAGIFTYNDKENTLDNILNEINSRITFKLNDFYQDLQGNYWFATQSDGLVKMSPDGKIFDKWTTFNGLPTNSLLRIESADNKTLWISTIDGLCSFDMTTGMIQIFKLRHGLASNEFLPRASLLTPDNRIIFGHSEGFTLIDPKNQIIDNSKTEVIISDISFHNQSIKKLESENYLDEPLEKIKIIVLPYSRNSFTIKFFTRDNYLPKFNNYSYRLKGLEENWIYLGENNQTTYTNLSPGKYVFEVKSTNKNNVVSDKATSLIIQIRSPWYFSLFAITVYLFIGILIVYLSMKIYKNRIQLKKEVELSEFKAQKEHELTENKLAFFTNISHDLKTPLTLISAPVNDLLKSDNLEKEQIKKLEVIKRNALHLYKLISDLVDFRKITLNQLPLKVMLTKLHQVIENIYEAFINECQKRDIDFTYCLNFDEQIFFDTEKIEKILWNLLANAVKFTPEGGKIWVKANLISQSEGKYLEILVGDTGQGISDQEKSRIFDRFYQVHQTTNINIGGSGIGLSIVNDLVTLHHGTITVESEAGKGSIFTILIPAEEKFYNFSEIVAKQTIADDSNRNHEKIVFELAPPVHYSSNIRKYNLPKMIIVEDNEEFREYLASHFNSRYKVITAPDGIEGFKLIKEFEPDMVITDALMPNLNGYELSRMIRENFSTSHIPIIMLTANSATEQKIDGLSSGVDSYVTKPVEIEFLDATVATLIQNRKKLKEKFLGIEMIDHEIYAIPESDVQFLNSLKNFILTNLSDENLNIDILVKHFSISRTHLNRKIKALTSFTPNNYIKHLRLKKAYELLKVKKSRVNEVAFETGFTDPNYFTMCFRKEFGESPSKIAE